jgi:hypothetical protein
VLDIRTSVPGWGRDLFLLRHVSVLEPAQSPMRRMLGYLSPEVKLPELEVGRSLAFIERM